MSHSIVIYANDKVGNMGTSNTIIFSVANPISAPSSTPANLAIVLVIALSLVVAIALIFFRRKHSKLRNVKVAGLVAEFKLF